MPVTGVTAVVTSVSGQVTGIATVVVSEGGVTLQTVGEPTLATAALFDSCHCNKRGGYDVGGRIQRGKGDVCNGCW